MMGFLALLAILLAQMNTLQNRPIVHLQVNHDAIDISCNGKMLELINAPTILHLPVSAPTPDPQNGPWSVEIRNLGPHAVTVIDKATFAQQILPGETIQIESNGKMYLVQR